MLYITLRTDKPESEIGLFMNYEQLAYIPWPAHRELAETIHYKLKTILADCDKQFSDVKGVIFYIGPGSFTGLRIGGSVANALADGLGIGIVGVNGEDWVHSGIELLQSGHGQPFVVPEYGAEPHITQPRK